MACCLLSKDREQGIMILMEPQFPAFLTIEKGWSGLRKSAQDLWRARLLRAKEKV